jgi:copper(I)-binding protein
VGASCTAAKTVEMHESYLEGNMMKMRLVAGIDVPAGGKVEFKPGGYHIMLIEPVVPLQTGNKVVVNLTFEKAGQVTVNADIR